MPSSLRRAHLRMDRLGEHGLRLAWWGTVWFAVFAPVSIFVYQFGFGLAALGFLLALSTGRIAYRRTPLDLPLLLFALVETASCLLSPYRSESLRALRGQWTLLYYVVFSQALRDSRQVATVYRTLLVSASIAAAYAIFQGITGLDLIHGHPLESWAGLHMATGFFGHHLTYGGSVLITACLVLGLITAAPTRRRRRFLGAALALGVGGVVVSLARTAWAGLVAAGVGLIPALGATRRRWGILALGTAILLASFAPPVRQRVGSLRQLTDDPRVRLWQTAVIIWQEYPVLGAGLGTYEILFPEYKVPGRYDATGNPHNESLAVLVSSGLVGFAAFVFLWFRFFRVSIGAYRRAPRPDPLRALLLGGILGTIGLLAGGMGQCFLYDEEVATLFWLTAAGTMVAVGEVRSQVRPPADRR